MYIVYTMVRSFINPNSAAGALDERPESWVIVIKEMFFGMVRWAC